MCSSRQQSGSPHLVVADPDAVVSHSKGDDVIKEGLGALVALGRCKDMRQHLLEQAQVRFTIKRLQQAL